MRRSSLFLRFVVFSVNSLQTGVLFSGFLPVVNIVFNNVFVSVREKDKVLFLEPFYWLFLNLVVQGGFPQNFCQRVST